MEKSEMMKRYEAETGSEAIDYLTEYPFDEYTRWLEAKAAAYDRLMSGGKKTLKEWANIFNRPMVVTQSRLIALACRDIPEIRTTKQLKHEYSDWIDPKDLYGEYVFFIPIEYIDFSGDWKDSLTLPDGWEEK